MTSSSDCPAILSFGGLARLLLSRRVAWPIPGVETASLNGWEEVAAMGGPWRERGFDAGSLRSPRPRREQRAEVMAREHERDRLGRVVLVYIAAVVMSFGLMLSLLHRGW